MSLRYFPRFFLFGVTSLISLFGVSSFFVLSVSATENALTTTEIGEMSPVVQVMSYGSVYGQSVQSQWRWSASHIGGGLFMTNNHVVDDGYGQLNEDFRLCVSLDETQRPDCRYTAHVVTRDSQMDIALLMIDETDIRGYPVDSSQFPVLSLSYDGVPATQSPVVAWWYPAIGAETITQTQWVVAWTVTNNDYRYIKTDALIAGGNSGWPLLFDGRIIGVNTYGIGFGQTLGFALDITQAQDIIQSARDAGSRRSVSPYASYYRLLSSTEKTKKLTDAFMSFSRDPDYLVRAYIPGQFLSLTLAKTHHALPQSLHLYFVPQYGIEDKDDLIYALSQQSLLDPSYQTLVDIEIGGHIFYDIRDKHDQSWGTYTNQKLYVWQLWSYVVLISIDIPLYDADVVEQAQKSLQELLDNISFVDGDVIAGPPTSLVSTLPDVRVRWLGHSQAYPRYGEWSLTISETEYINTAITKHNPGLWSDRAMIYETATQDLAPQQHDTFVFKGYDAYRVCSKPWQYNTSHLNSLQVTPQWEMLNMTICHVHIRYPDNRDGHNYIITTTMYVRESLWETLVPVLPSLVTYLIDIPSRWETIRSDISISDPQAPFGDISDQSDDFVRTAHYLVDHNYLAPSETLDPYQAITRSTYISTLAQWVRKVWDKKTLTDLTSQVTTIMDLSLDDPVRQDLVYGVDLVVALLLAGEETYPQSAYDIAVYHTKGNSSWDNARDRLRHETRGDDVETWYSSPLGLWLFEPYKDVYHHPDQGIIVYDLVSTESFVTIFPYERALSTLDQCLDRVAREACQYQYEELLHISLSYDVLNKGEMINHLIVQMGIDG